jgi:hypothetical protein
MFQDPEYTIWWQLELANKQWPIYQSLAACTYEDLMSNQSSNRYHPLLGWYTNLKLIICAWAVCNTKNSDGNKVFWFKDSFLFPLSADLLYFVWVWGLRQQMERLVEQCIVGPKKYGYVRTIYLEIQVLQFWWLADSKYHISGNQGSSILVACRFQECPGLLTHSKFHFADNLAVQFMQGQYNLHTSDMRSGPQIWTDIWMKLRVIYFFSKDYHRTAKG